MLVLLDVKEQLYAAASTDVEKRQVRRYSNATVFPPPKKKNWWSFSSEKAPQKSFFSSVASTGGGQQSDRGATETEIRAGE